MSETSILSSSLFFLKLFFQARILASGFGRFLRPCVCILYYYGELLLRLVVVIKSVVVAVIFNQHLYAVCLLRTKRFYFVFLFLRALSCRTY